MKSFFPSTLRRRKLKTQQSNATWLFWFCVRGKVRKANRMIIVTSFESSVFKCLNIVSRFAAEILPMVLPGYRVS